MFEEKNTGTNLPAQIEIHAAQGNEYEFLFITKGGGSANKSFLFQQTRAILDPLRLLEFLEEKIRAIGTAACPPYHLAIAIGGTSAEFTLKAVKLASCRWLDGLPTTGNMAGRAFRDLDLEAQVHEMTRRIGIGAQFGGKYFCHDVRVVRLPRHGASLPVGIGVSCSADRQARAKITGEGVFLEQLETEPARFLPEPGDWELGGEVVPVDLRGPWTKSAPRSRTFRCDPAFAYRPHGGGPRHCPRQIARAAGARRAHAAIHARPHGLLRRPGQDAGGHALGLLRPHHAGRMDSYVAEFMEAGGSFITLAKGNRSKQVTEACRKYGGFYLGSIGGPAAILAKNCIRKVEVLEYPELGMEAIWKIEVVDFPAFIVVDDKGNDFFAAF